MLHQCSLFRNEDPREGSQLCKAIFSFIPLRSNDPEEPAGCADVVGFSWPLRAGVRGPVRNGRVDVKGVEVMKRSL